MIPKRRFNRTWLLGFLASLFLFHAPELAGQNSIRVDNKEYRKYEPGYFRPHRGIFYSVYVSPVVTVDPLGFGGKSALGVSLGAQVRLWESKTPENLLTGIKVKGFYTALGHEYYPKQYSKTYASLWMRFKAFIPLAGKLDVIYASGYGLRGLTTRYCVGFEVERVTIFVCGEFYYFNALGTRHPNFESPYTNAGEIMAVIPIFKRKEK